MSPFVDKNTNPVSCNEEFESRKARTMTNFVGRKDEESDGNCANEAFKKLVSIHEFLGLFVEGFEKEVDSLLRILEAQKGRSVIGSSFRRTSSLNSHFERELRKLDCSANYNISSNKGRRSKKCGLGLVSKCLGYMWARGKEGSS